MEKEENKNTNEETKNLSLEEIGLAADNLFEKNKNIFFVSVVAIIAFGLGVYAYYNMYKAPREEAANKELYKAELEFKRDSFLLALNGRNIVGQANNFIGLTGIIHNYGGTAASNLAHYYAGVATLKMGEPALALEYLKNFSGEELLQVQAYNMMGDAVSETNDLDGALVYYKKAANYSKNIALQCYSKYKAGKVLEKQGKNAEAKVYFQEILDADTQLGESLGVDKDIVRLK